VVPEIFKAFAEISSRYYGRPEKKLHMIGVTGTKGKTTTTHMIKDILQASGKKVGLIGTIHTTYGDVDIPSDNTTPLSLDLFKLLNDMVNAGIEYLVMEVSSHGLALHRVYGIHFEIAVFTNLSPEHLDFHKDMNDYFEAKKKLFSMCDVALINGDDIYGTKIRKDAQCKVITYGLDNQVDITANNIVINNNNVIFKMFVNKILETIKIGIPRKIYCI